MVFAIELHLEMSLSLLLKRNGLQRELIRNYCLMLESQRNFIESFLCVYIQ